MSKATPACTLLTAALLLMPGSRAATAAEGVDQSPLPVQIVRSFPQFRPRRPVAITHAGDGSGRLFIVSQYGQLLVIPNNQSVTADDAKVFLDIEYKTDYQDNENEEGLLGLAFHPKYKENGQFFIYYTIKDPPHTSVISRLTVSKDDPNKADPKSEQVLMTVKQPFWNHNSGNLLFGPEGYLYIGLGDGGAANDPHNNGQNLSTLLGSILRIDVDRQEGDKRYAIPRDNPFVGVEGARPEIYSYGWRNPWGMSFDRETGLFWVADVGQNIWEEINIVVKGGNYGWKLRESMHVFDERNAQPGPGRSPAEQNKPDPKRRDDLIDPIWEYHHDTDGKSITGGAVYRGSRVPELVGHYVYGDYVSGKFWALKYDHEAKRVVANRPIEGPPGTNVPVMCIGDDEKGELYFGDTFGQIWWPASK